MVGALLFIEIKWAQDHVCWVPPEKIGLRDKSFKYKLMVGTLRFIELSMAQGQM